MARLRRRLPSNRTWVWLCVGTLILLRALTLSRAAGQRDFTVNPLREGPCRIVRVSDGQTLLVVQQVTEGEVVVRLLGVELPPPDLIDGMHTVAALRFTEAFVARGSARLVLDNHRLDPQGRYLAYVEVDRAQLSEALLAAGLARFSYLPGNSQSMDRRLKAAEDGARIAKLGLWK